MKELEERLDRVQKVVDEIKSKLADRAKECGPQKPGDSHSDARLLLTLGPKES